MAQSENEGVDSIAAKSVGFHEESGTFRTEFDYQTRRPSVAIAIAVAEAKDESMTDLPPLDTRIDTDALDAIFSAASNRTRHRNGSVTFGYVGCRITMNSHGTIIVDPADERTDEEG